MIFKINGRKTKHKNNNNDCQFTFEFTTYHKETYKIDINKINKNTIIDLIDAHGLPKYVFIIIDMFYFSLDIEKKEIMDVVGIENTCINKKHIEEISNIFFNYEIVDKIRNF